MAIFVSGSFLLSRPKLKQPPKPLKAILNIFIIAMPSILMIMAIFLKPLIMMCRNSEPLKQPEKY